jgi:hypothetical protein
MSNQLQAAINQRLFAQEITRAYPLCELRNTMNENAEIRAH